MNSLNHLAIICDGNGRWAKARGLDRSAGHEEGLHKLEEITRRMSDLGIPYVSFYVFSLDNWKRPKDEVDALMALANRYFNRYPEFIENGVRIIVSGTREGLSEENLRKMDECVAATKDCKKITVNLCMNYSGRREIEDAIAKGARTVEEIGKNLYQPLPEPDLIIRTGGHQRLSDFLLWGSAYAELAFTDTLFPDLSMGEIAFYIKRFASEQRNFGGVMNG